jgi:hypothetical protein
MNRQEDWFVTLIQRVPHELSFDKAATTLYRKTGVYLEDAEYWIYRAVYAEGLDRVVGELRVKGYL